MNVSQDVSQGALQENRGGKKMKYNDKMADAINDFILNNDFLTRYIVDGVKEKIYDERMYTPDMINEVIENDLNAGYNGGYITDFITDAINIIPLIDSIHEQFKDEFIEIAQGCNRRNY